MEQKKIKLVDLCNQVNRKWLTLGFAKTHSIVIAVYGKNYRYLPGISITHQNCVQGNKYLMDWLNKLC
jgi:hypothetical protein